MPPPPTPTDEMPTDEMPIDRKTAEAASAQPDLDLSRQNGSSQVLTDPDAPLTFVPHAADGSLPHQPTRIRTRRFGVLEEHELVRLLGDIEDERARSRFRESIYISVFVWVAIAWLVFYGPRYLWHAPKLILPSEVLRQQALTRLEAPTLKNAPTARNSPAPAARPAPRVDSRTLEHLRSAEPKPAPRTPAEAPRPPVPATLPPSERPNLPVPSAPQPVPARPAPPVAGEAPTPQPSTKPNFDSGGSAGQNIQSAIQGAARTRGSGGGATARGGSGKAALGTGVEILSDTQGVNFDPYLRRILRQIYDQWILLLPEEVNPPLSKQGSTLVRFSILPDGSIGSMNLDGSTHDSALNKAAWGSITSVGQFPPLPPQFHGPKLELRINYLVNQKDGQ